MFLVQCLRTLCKGRFHRAVLKEPTQQGHLREETYHKRLDFKFKESCHPGLACVYSAILNYFMSLIHLMSLINQIGIPWWLRE